MAEEKTGKKVRIWEIIVLVELVAIIFLGLHLDYVNKTISAQGDYIISVEKVLAEKVAKEKVLSDKLLHAMGLLQGVVNEIGQEKQTTAINNVAPSSQAPASAPEKQ